MVYTLTEPGSSIVPSTLATIPLHYCDFKTAYKSLGGESGRMSDAAILRLLKRRKERERYDRRLSDALERFKLAAGELDHWKTVLRESEPFSEVWCDAQNAIPKLEFVADEAMINYQNVIDEGR